MEYPQHLALPGGHLAVGGVLLHGEIPVLTKNAVLLENVDLAAFRG
jgi:hypothetical protein